MYNRISFLIIVMLGYHMAAGQDYILKINTQIETVLCENIIVEKGVIKCKALDNNETLEVKTEDVISMNFNENGSDKLHLISLKLDTIYCYIESILKSQIVYRKENNTKHTIDKKDVFFLGFGEVIDIPVNRFYLDSFKEIHKKAISHKPEIIKKDRTHIEIVDLISCNENKTEIKLLSREAEIETFIETTEIATINFRDPSELLAMKFTDNYFLTGEDRIVKVQINSYKNGYIDFGIVKNDNTIDMVQSVKSLKGLYFYNYQELPEFKLANQKDSLQLTMKIDFNMGVGHLVSSTSGYMSDEVEDYIKELRTGLSMEFNMHVFVSNHFGIGFKYNRFSTKNSMPNVMSDDIKINFVGGSLLLNSPLGNDFGYFYAGLAVGYVKETNDGELVGEEIRIEGSTVGADISLGFDFYIVENVAIGIQGGFMLGAIKKYKVEGQEVELDEPDNINRVDGLAGLKIYF